jgi:hypothetical protein
MTIGDFIKFLETNTGYLKKGKSFLSRKFNLSEQEVQLARSTVKKKLRIDRNQGNIDFNNKSNILIFDLELSPSIGYFWDVWGQNIYPEQIIQPWFIISWAAKWYEGSEIMSGVLTPEEIKNCNDSRIVKELWKLFDKADIIIAHNLKKFDNKKANTRFVLHNLPQPSPYKMLDTLTIVRKKFSFLHNKLDYVNKEFNLAPKMENEGFSLWVKCMEGNQKALDTMIDYNIQDVASLEELYTKLRPWIDGHPNINIDTEELVCNNCGSSNLVYIGVTSKSSYSYKTYRCNSCTSLSRERTYDKETKKPKLRSI